MKSILISLLCLVTIVVAAQEKSSKSSPQIPTGTVASQGTAQIGGKSVAYKATTGYLQVQDKEGVHKANMFYVSYIKQGETNLKTRPITFVFNGGPGAASVWLHMGALGPKRIAMTVDGNAQKPPYSIVNNEYSWLDITDLVFIDPVGTGFSKPAEGEKADQFYGFENDVKWVSDFIRQWTSDNNRWGSPKYLAGESYGTTRACGVVEYLMEEYSMYFNGISLISCALDFQTLREFENNDMPFICNLPVYTYAALYHNKLKPAQSQDKDLIAKVEAFALNEYALALLQGDKLTSAQKQSIANSLELYTGISADIYLQHNLRLPSHKFRKYLLDSDDKIIGRYDVRLLMDDPINNRDYAGDDPSYTQISGAFGTAFNEYVRTDLQYKNNLPFYVIGNVQPWKFSDGKYLNVTSELRQAMYTNPYMKVWMANGLYDLATSYFGTQYFVNHMNLSPELQKNISMTYYKGGHMMYFVESELKQLKEDAVKLYQAK